MPTPSDRTENPPNTPDVVVEAVLGAQAGNPPVVSDEGDTHPAGEAPVAPEEETPVSEPPQA